MLFLHAFLHRIRSFVSVNSTALWTSFSCSVWAFCCTGKAVCDINDQDPVFPDFPKQEVQPYTCVCVCVLQWSWFGSSRLTQCKNISFYRVSGFDRNSHHRSGHGRSQDAAGVFWNLLRHVLTEGRCQLTQYTHLKLNTERVHTLKHLLLFKYEKLGKKFPENPFKIIETFPLN